MREKRICVIPFAATGPGVDGAHSDFFLLAVSSGLRLHASGNYVPGEVLRMNFKIEGPPAEVDRLERIIRATERKLRLRTQAV